MAGCVHNRVNHFDHLRAFAAVSRSVPSKPPLSSPVRRQEAVQQLPLRHRCCRHRFKPCMTDIYLHIDARMADYIRTHPGSLLKLARLGCVGSFEENSKLLANSY